MIWKILLIAFGALAGAFKLPEVYLSELKEYISLEEFSASAKEVETRVEKLLSSSSTDFSTFYSQITQHRGELEGKLTRHCGEEKQCLHVCGLLIDVLEVVYRQRSLNRNLIEKPTSLDKGILVHMQNLRIYEFKYIVYPFFYFKAVKAVERIMVCGLRNLQLWNNIAPRCQYKKVIGILEERQADFLKQFVQRSASYYLNRMYDITDHVYPRLHSGSVALAPSSASAWYRKVSRSDPHALKILRTNGISASLSRLKEKPELLNVDDYRTLITDLLYVHQRLLDFDFNSLSVAERLEYLKLDEEVLQLYTTLEEAIFPSIRSHLKESVFIMHDITMKQSVELRMTTGTHRIDKLEVYLVRYEVSNDIVFTTHIKESALRIFIFRSKNSFAISSDGIERDTCDVIRSNYVFTEDLLQSLLKDKIIKKDIEVKIIGNPKAFEDILCIDVPSTS